MYGRTVFIGSKLHNRIFMECIINNEKTFDCKILANKTQGIELLLDTGFGITVGNYCMVPISLY